MTNQNTDNAVTSTSYLLKRLGIKYTENYFSKQLQTHPFYPSLAAVSDIFESYNLESEAHRVSYEELLNIQIPFIAPLTVENGTFIVVEKVTPNEVFFHLEDKHLKSIKKDNFIKVWNSIVFQVKPSTKSEEPDYMKHRRKELLEKAKIPVIVAFVLFSFIGLAVPKPSITNLIPLFLAKITGLFFAILLVKQELGYYSEIVNKLCTLSKSAGCNEVLRSKVSKLFGNVYLADVGLIWFTASALYLLFISIMSAGKPTITLLGWFAMCSIPMIIFSISYQIFVVKKYCPLCLGIMLMLTIEVALLPVMYDFRFQFPQINEIWLLFTILCIVTFIWFELKQLLIDNKTLQNSEINYLHLKRNPNVIQSRLMESDEIEMSKLPAPICLTNNQSNMVFTEVINLYCNPCKKTFEKIKLLLAHSCENSIDVQVILLSDIDNIEHVMTKTALHLLALAEQQPVNYVKDALFDWFEILDYELWSKKYPVFVNDSHKLTLKNHVTWFSDNNLSGTPTSILNNKKIPTNIDLMDFQYFFD